MPQKKFNFVVFAQVSIAVPKTGLSELAGATQETPNPTASSEPSYSQYYEHYWSDKAAWGNYGTYKVCLHTNGVAK